MQRKVEFDVFTMRQAKRADPQVLAVASCER